MAPKPAVPNAWDDDWETQADRAAADERRRQMTPATRTTETSGGALLTPDPSEAEPVLTRAEQLAKHEEANRRLWQSADNPQEFDFVLAGGGGGGNGSGTSGPAVVSASAFRPPMTVLSRKPPPQLLRRRDDDAEAAEAEAAAAARMQETREQSLLRQQRDLEAKQRKYEEARAKIFGEPLPSNSKNGNGSGSSSSNNNNNNNNNNGNTNTSTPASSRQASPAPRINGGNNGTVSSQQPSGGHGAYYNNRGGRGRGRGYRGDRGDRSGGDGSFGRGQYDNSFNRRLNQYPAVGGGNSNIPTAPAATRELYDPNYAPKPGTQARRHNHGSGPGSAGASASGSEAASPLPSRTGTPREEEFVMRAPRGPDGSGRGGFGFSRRGGFGGSVSSG